MQVVCRDRNRLAIQADIVGAALHGIENICCLTGDDVTAGDEPEARRVFDLDGPQLIAPSPAMARGDATSPAARSSPRRTLFVGAVENPGAPPFEYRAERALKKARAGARFLQLQICYRARRGSRRSCAEARRIGLARARGAAARRSASSRGARRCEFMDDNVPGHLGARARRSSASRAPPTRARRPSSSPSSRRDTRSRSPGVRGLHLISFRKDDAVARSCERLGIHPSSKRETRVDTVICSRGLGPSSIGHRPAVLHHRRADQPDRAQGLRRASCAAGDLSRCSSRRRRAGRRSAPTCSTSTPASRWSTRPSCWRR